ncbi:MAG: hypothetical protein KDI13_08055 [Alphaproteobacteria bacterium]|nr:hypothetical protein [Alphaproteobacteria bacterium]
MKRKTKGWSEERRRKQSENIRKTKPWTKTTGPRTPEGKEAVSQNALKHGLHSADIQELRRLLRHQKACVKSVLARQNTQKTLG